MVSISNATVTIGNGGTFGAGYAATGTGTVTVGSAGVLNVGNGGGRAFIGGGNGGAPFGTGVLTVSTGGTVNVAAPGTFPNESLYFAGYGGSGTINLNGGTLATARDIVRGTGVVTDGVLNFNGGTLKAATGYVANLGFLSGAMTVNIQAGGATIDSNGFNISIAPGLLDGGGGGGLTKIGTGTLTLSGANTYTGTTTVSVGTLKTGIPGTLGATSALLSVAGTGTLDLGQTAQTTGAATVSGGTIQNGTLTASSVAATSGVISAALAGSGGLTKTSAGTLTVSGASAYTGGTTLSAGTIVIAASGTAGMNPPAGYKIAAVGDSITFAGYGPGGYGTTTAWPERLQTILGNQFVVSNNGASGTTAIANSGAAYVNSAAYSSAIASTPNAVVIQLGTNDAAGSYFALASANGYADFVTSLTTLVNNFKNTANSPTVWLCLPPADFSGRQANLLTLLPYIQQVATATGSGLIDNQTAFLTQPQLYPDGLHPNGTGEQWMAQNIYTSLGATFFNNGPLGTGLVTLSGGTLSDDGTARTLTNSLAITGNVTFASTGSGSLTFDPTGLTTPSTVTLSNSPTLTVTNTTTIKEAISGTGFTKAGSGTLTLTGVNTYTGLTTVSNGTLSITNAAGLGTVAAGTSVDDLATLALSGGIAVGAEALGLSGAGVGGDGALRSTAGTNSLAGAVTLNASSTVKVDAGTLSLTGAITDVGTTTLTKTGTGVLDLNGGSKDFDTLAATGGTTNLNVALGTDSSAVSVTGTGTKLKFGSVSQTLSSLTIGAGATVIFTSGTASGALTGGGGGGKAPSFDGGSAVVPEPGTLGLLLVGALGLLNRRRRQE